MLSELLWDVLGQGDLIEDPAHSSCAESEVIHLHFGQAAEEGLPILRCPLLHHPLLQLLTERLAIVLLLRLRLLGGQPRSGRRT